MIWYFPLFHVHLRYITIHQKKGKILPNCSKGKTEPRHNHTFSSIIRVNFIIPGHYKKLYNSNNLVHLLSYYSQ